MSKPQSPRKVGDKEALSVGTQIRGSAQKLGLVAALIRGKKAGDALNILQFSTKGMAVDARKVLASAIANAENNHNLDVDALVVAEAAFRPVRSAGVSAGGSTTTSTWSQPAATL